MLETPRLILRVPTKADLDPWAALDAEEDTTRFIGGIQTREGARRGLEAVLEMWARRGCSLFSVFERSSGNWIGRTGPWVPDDALGTEIGWAYAAAAQGRGYATEAASAAINWAFEELAWAEVIHCIDRGNAASIAVAERLGSSWWRSDIEADGKPVEVYGQSRSDWFGH